jgi:transposase
MEVRCPHCKLTFIIRLKTGNYSSPKANKARRLNSQLGGRPAKLTDELLEHIYLSIAFDGHCTGDRFAEAIETTTGTVYSRSRIFYLLKKFKARFAKTREVIRLENMTLSNEKSVKPRSATAQKKEEKLKA